MHLIAIVNAAGLGIAACVVSGIARDCERRDESEALDKLEALG